jgi:hypothetical protein
MADLELGAKNVSVSAIEPEIVRTEIQYHITERPACRSD